MSEQESKTRSVDLPASGQTIDLPELSTEQVLQLIRLAKQVITRVPDLMTLVDDARLEYLKGEAQGFVSKPYFDGLDEKEQKELDDRLTAEFTDWFFFEDLTSEQQEALKALEITEETLKNDPIQFSFPSDVPTLALAAKIFPEVYDAAANEIIMAVAVVLMPSGRLEKAVKTNTVEAQLLDYRAELTQKLKPEDFIHLASAVVSYTISELEGLGGPLGQVITQVQSQLAGLGASQEEAESQEESETNSEKSEATSSSSSAETITD